MILEVVKMVDQVCYLHGGRLFNWFSTSFVGKLDQFLLEINRLFRDYLQVNFDGLGVSLQHGIDVIQRQQGIERLKRIIGILIHLN